MELIQRVKRERSDYYEPKEYVWSIIDRDGEYCTIGSLATNTRFKIKQERTDKETLSYAQRHLRSITECPCIFEHRD